MFLFYIVVRKKYLGTLFLFAINVLFGELELRLMIQCPDESPICFEPKKAQISHDQLICRTTCPLDIFLAYSRLCCFSRSHLLARSPQSERLEQANLFSDYGQYTL